MPYPVPNQSTILQALGNFLTQVALPGVEVVVAQDNRVPEPSATQGQSDFIVITPVLRERLATNIYTAADVSFTGAINGNLLTVSQMNFGTILLGSTLSGTGVAAGTLIESLQSGSLGGTGIYVLSNSQNVAQEKMAAGNWLIDEKVELTMQLDVHSALMSRASDMAQAISTLFRDDTAWSWFNANYPGIAPLHADTARQVPFQNAQMQWESRYVMEACLEVDQTITVPMQYADNLQVTLMPIRVH